MYFLLFTQKWISIIPIFTSIGCKIGNPQILTMFKILLNLQIFQITQTWRFFPQISFISLFPPNMSYMDNPFVMLLDQSEIIFSFLTISLIKFGGASEMINTWKLLWLTHGDCYDQQVQTSVRFVPKSQVPSISF